MLVNYASERESPIERRPSVIFQAAARERFVPPRAPIRSVLCKGAWNISRVANRAFCPRPATRAFILSRPAVNARYDARRSLQAFYESARFQVNFLSTENEKNKTRHIRILFIEKKNVYITCIFCVKEV